MKTRMVDILTRINPNDLKVKSNKDENSEDDETIEFLRLENEK